ncbi:MAG TPA: CHAP domain-containing protein [Solirubrobacteraceae bacterium]|nr:CHAP domain-containing protein [Solirubrobacteraceae bacterium]
MFRRPVGLCVLLALLGGASVGTASSLADDAPPQWQPTSADVARTVRPCPTGVSAPAPPVCWSMTEDTSAWMAQPAGSPYGWGQCTYYVGLMRPDLWNDRAPPSVDPLTDWDAWTWTAHAQAEGLSVDGNPRSGDVMVWSRRAVGNDTGHVAIVDTVGPANPATGEVEITISEMNLDGVDDAAQGQGDTIVVEVPRAQLVPGMIQFIHRPGSEGATESDPSLAVGVWSNQVATVSRSPAPISATVTTASGTFVKSVSVVANRVAALALPAGIDKVCVSQPAATGWNSASSCASGTSPPSRATVARARTGGQHRARRHGHARRRPRHGRRARHARVRP